MRAEVSNALNVHQLPRGVDRRPPHRVERGAGLLDPVHQEVVLLEVRQELLAQERKRRRGHGQRDRDDRHGALRAPRSVAAAAGGSRALRPVTTGASRACVCRGSSSSDNAGVTMSATRSDAEDRQHVRRGRAAGRTIPPGPRAGTRDEHEDDDEAAVDDGAAHFDATRRARRRRPTAGDPRRRSGAAAARCSRRR